MLLLQSGQTTRHTMDSDDTASSRPSQPGYTSIAVAQTWSPGHLRSLASDVASSLLNDPTVEGLHIEEGGVSPWKDRATADRASLQDPSPLDSPDPLDRPAGVTHKDRAKIKPGTLPSCCHMPNTSFCIVPSCCFLSAECHNSMMEQWRIPFSEMQHRLPIRHLLLYSNFADHCLHFELPVQEGHHQRRCHWRKR